MGRSEVMRKEKGGGTQKEGEGKGRKREGGNSYDYCSDPGRTIGLKHVCVSVFQENNF